MKLVDIYARIQQRLTELGLSAARASKLAGKPDAIRNMKRAIDEGRGGVSTETIFALAAVLHCSPEYLLNGGANVSSEAGLSELQAEAVRIAGLAVLEWLYSHPSFAAGTLDQGSLDFAARLIAQIARSRRFLEAVARGDEAGLDAARIALELQPLQ